MDGTGEILCFVRNGSGDGGGVNMTGWGRVLWMVALGSQESDQAVVERIREMTVSRKERRSWAGRPDEVS